MITSLDFNTENVVFGTNVKACGYGVQKIPIRYRIKEDQQSSLYVVVPNVLRSSKEQFQKLTC